jgi:hypothetical protein
MPVEAWLAAFGTPVNAADLRIPQARALVAFANRYGAGVAGLVEVRQGDERELVILDIRTGAPQRPVYPIMGTERVGVLFGADGWFPLPVMLRDDFPDTEHQQTVPEGYPAVICIDDRPWPEAQLTWTPAELLQRILTWFQRAARGELHDARQPLDPNLLRTSLNFIIARSMLAPDASEDLIAEIDPELANIMRVKRADGAQIGRDREPFCIATYRVGPAQMRRLKYSPATLASLEEMLAERGIDLFGDLAARLRTWLGAGPVAAWRLNSRFAVIVEMPIVSPRGGQADATDIRAFITNRPAGDIAIALGVAEKPPVGLSRVGYVQTIGASSRDLKALAEISVQAAEVHLEFDRELATRLAGRAVRDIRKAVLAGAGAIGSHIADYLAREGRFRWTVIDEDRLLPHNLARHIALNNAVTQPKARVVSSHLNAILADSGVIAEPLPMNLFAEGDDLARVDSALNQADLIIDGTASILAARHLSDHPSRARRLSAFFNPSGAGAVLLAEPADRSLTLRDIEAQYLGLVLRTERLDGHLATPAETIAYTGACRAITNRIPESRAAILSGLAASGISRAVDAEPAVIAIWTLTPDGQIVADRADANPVRRYRARDWLITVDARLVRTICDMRDARLPSETGGVLFGLVDIPNKSIHLVDASPAPGDSIEERVGFERGVHGIEELIDSVQTRTAGQVRYVGEWHSHPPCTSARPSNVDALQIDWLAALLEMDSLPGLMVIAADKELAIIFAEQRAEELPRDVAA